MLKIQVLGHGLIPRGYGLAPRKEFFKADLNLIQTILMTPGLKVNMLNPDDGKIVAVTNANVKRLWDRYRSDSTAKYAGGIINNRPAPPTPNSNEKPNVGNTGGGIMGNGSVNKDVHISNASNTGMVGEGTKIQVDSNLVPPMGGGTMNPVTPEVQKNVNTQAVNVTKQDEPKPEETNETKPNVTPAAPETPKGEDKDAAEEGKDSKDETPAPTSGGIRPILNDGPKGNQNKQNNQNNQNKK